MKTKALLALMIAAVGLSGCIVIEGGARNHRSDEIHAYSAAP